MRFPSLLRSSVSLLALCLSLASPLHPLGSSSASAEAPPFVAETPLVAEAPFASEAPFALEAPFVAKEAAFEIRPVFPYPSSPSSTSSATEKAPRVEEWDSDWL